MSKPALLVCLAALLAALCDVSQAESQCGDKTPSTYAPAAGDSANTTQLHAIRRLAGNITSLEVNVCSGELKVERSPEGNQMELRITSPGADRPLRDYLHDFDVSGGKARVNVRVPNNYHASVTLTLPAVGFGSSDVNLGAGTLVVDASVLGQGDRRLNLGAGNATVVLHGDRNYSELKVNVGMGHFEDDRKGGSSANLVISREMSGTGRGDMEINVGAGKLVLQPASE